MGAVYLDGGLDAARGGGASACFRPSSADVETHARLDYKSRLQERSQALCRRRPSTGSSAESGPDHDKRFEVAISLAGRE